MTGDLRHAARSLRKQPLLFVVGAGALAVGIGASTAVFSVVDAVLLRPLPFAEPERLVVVWQSIPSRDAPYVAVSYRYFLEMRARSRSLSAMAAMPNINSGFALGGKEPTRVQGRLVSGDFFEVLGARPALGRTFGEEENKVGAPRVVVLSHGLWQRRFGGDPGLMGRTLEIDGTAMTVIGVMPREFRYPAGADLWTPVVPAIPNEVANPEVAWAVVLGRLAPGVTREQARNELDAVTAEQLRIHAPSAPPVKTVMTPILHEIFGPSRRALPVVLGAVLLVLVLACANVATLLLARGASREREVAVRLALGASRGRLVSQLLAESALITLAGGLAGTALAVWGLDALIALVPAEVPRLREAAIDVRVLAFALALTVLSTLGAGLVPAVLASRASLAEVLAQATRSAGLAAGQVRARAVLVAIEAAIALVLLAGAGLLTRTFQNLRGLDLGFDPQHVLAAELAGPRGKYEAVEERRQLYRALIERLDAVPGVEAVAFVSQRPLMGPEGWDWPYLVEGQSESEAEHNPALNLQMVTARFFDVMRIPLRRGRTFTDRDAAGLPVAVVVSEVLARRAWPGQDPIGRRVRVPLPSPPYTPTWMTVIGVVGEARYRELQTSRLDFYMSHLQSEPPLNHLVVRTGGDPLARTPALRAAVHSIDRELILSGVTSMPAVVDEALGGARFGMRLLSGFALVALLLAALGIYGVVSFVVSRRTREVGIRMALGARSADVISLVLRQGMTPVAAGLVVGLGLALILARLSASLLFAVPPHDPTTLAAAGTVLCAAAVLACALPAWRAARLDPVQALRDE